MVMTAAIPAGLGNQHGVEVGSFYAAAAAPQGGQSGLAPAASPAGQPLPGNHNHTLYRPDQISWLLLEAV